MTRRIDYLPGMEVTPSTLSTVVQTGGGRFVKLTGGTWEPQYCYTDHRGDIRVVYRANSTTGTAEVVQEDHLTPFGVQMVGMGRTNWPENQYRYQGKELNTTGFDTNGDNITDSRLYQYDFGARQYDPLIGRWHSEDPIMQYVSPYMAMGNDWVNRVDPTGMEDNMAKYIRAYYQEINQFLLTARRNRAEEIDQIYGRGVYVGNPAFYWRNTLYKMAGGSGGESTFQVATFSNGTSIVTGRGGEIDHHNASTRSDGRTGAYVQIRGEIIYTPYSDEAPFMYTDVICRWTDFPGVDTYHSDNPDDYRRPEMVPTLQGSSQISMDASHNRIGFVPLDVGESYGAYQMANYRSNISVRGNQNQITVRVTSSNTPVADGQVVFGARASLLVNGSITQTQVFKNGFAVFTLPSVQNVSLIVTGGWTMYYDYGGAAVPVFHPVFWPFSLNFTDKFFLK